MCCKDHVCWCNKNQMMHYLLSVYLTLTIPILPAANQHKRRYIPIAAYTDYYLLMMSNKSARNMERLIVK